MSTVGSPQIDRAKLPMILGPWAPVARRDSASVCVCSCDFLCGIRSIYPNLNSDVGADKADFLIRINEPETRGGRSRGEVVEHCAQVAS